ncbi:hypothetical protein [Moheibacter stercoris]|uniref:PEP-CTERM protein-sorting domain-containing protein n=1 Tax=Moheibacter stercoris TaxID=1628251 RepID=A0ABV2LPP2_9FLAO
MRYLGIILIVFNLQFGFGQFFESSEESEDVEYTFNQSNEEVISDPDQGVDAGTAGEPIPINQHLLLLPLFALGIGIYYFHRRNQINYKV